MTTELYGKVYTTKKGWVEFKVSAVEPIFGSLYIMSSSPSPEPEDIIAMEFMKNLHEALEYFIDVALYTDTYKFYIVSAAGEQYKVEIIKTEF